MYQFQQVGFLFYYQNIFFKVFHSSRMPMITWVSIVTGEDPGCQVRGYALKRNCAERREALKMLGYFVRKTRFYANKSYFFQFRREAQKFVGGARRVRSPLDPPLRHMERAIFLYIGKH